LLVIKNNLIGPQLRYRLLQQIQTPKGGVKEQPRAIDPAEAPG
jgi:hypothetical protein